MYKYLAITLFWVCGSGLLFAQAGKDTLATPKDTLKPYQKYTDLPAFNILERDSATIFNTFNIPEGKPVAIMLFSPDCKHCRRTIKALLSGMDSISNVQFYIVTSAHSNTEIKDFYKEHNLARYKNIVEVGRDFEYFFLSFYDVHFVPDIALYDEHKKLIHLLEGETTASQVYKYLHP